MNDTHALFALSVCSQLLDSISDALLLISRQGSIVASNTAGRNILASMSHAPRTLEDFLFAELSLGDVFFKNDLTPIQLRKLRIAESSYVVRGLFSEGHLLLVLSDVTDMKRMAQDLSAYFVQLLRFRMALHCIDDGIILADAFEQIVFMNAAMHTLLSERKAPTNQSSLADFESVFGSFPDAENSICVISDHVAKALEQANPSHLLIEKRPLLLPGDKLHGFLVRFSQKSMADTKPANGHYLKNIVMAASAPPNVEAVAPRPVRRESTGGYALRGFVGQSKAVLHIKDIIKKVAPSSSTVLLHSESGTGKELLARSLHELSGRINGPFIKLNCASLPESLLEAEVFGYDSGAFTGAKKSGNPGLFEQAHTGTIFLDELGEMSFSLQAKLLRIIQEKEVQRIGGQGLKQLDVRVVCATNRDLMHLVEQGKFRSDLLFRLNVVSITMPPLRDRKEDIKSLIIHYLRHYSQLFKKNVSGVSKDVYYQFMNYDWPGNVRELGNVLEYAFNVIDGGVIERKHLPQYILDSSLHSGSAFGRLDTIVTDYSYQVIMNTLEQYNGNKAAAASALGISRSKLYRLLAGKCRGEMLPVPLLS